MPPVDGGSGGGAGGGDAGSGGGDAGAPFDAGFRGPLSHRPVGEMCSHSRPAGIRDMNAFGCTSDAECDAGINGRCSVTSGGALMNRCTYDECFADSDCPAGVPCECRSIANANVCLTSSGCTLDAQCGDGGYCSLSKMSSFSCSETWQCHTPQDRCLNDFDCSDAGTGLCAYDAINVRWDCALFCAIP
jgi:hypothetical protein